MPSLKFYLYGHKTLTWSLSYYAQSSADTTDSSNSSTGKKAVVVYFSGSGNTKRVAELVANETGAAIFELVPKNPYTEDDLNWRDEKSRVQKEHNDTSLQNIELN